MPTPWETFYHRARLKHEDIKLRLRRFVVIMRLINGAVVHLGERLICIQEVRGSNPLGSIFLLFLRYYCTHLVNTFF